jgi:phosphosulfolactate phosphohydrolase-like enzyme
VAVVGCGWRGHRSSEDEAAAGVILNHLGKRGVRLDRRAQRVAGRYLSRPKESLYRNSAAKRLGRLGYGGDIGFCLTEDIVPVVPRLQGGTFVGKW